MGRRRRLPPPAGKPATGSLPRWTVVLAGVAAGVAVAVIAWAQVRDTTPAPAADPFALTPVSSRPYRNTGPAARYVGSEACRSCHQGRHASCRHTGMGRSMAEVDPADEPPDGAFDHPASKRRYQVVRRDGRLWHRELLLAPGPDEVVLAEFPVRYVVGSGRHSRTYLVEADGFLVESPVSWYTSRRAWDMSPGYNGPDQVGFERATGEGCLVCHAGQATAVDRSLHRMTVTETAIGCERCHGPGSLHLARHVERGTPGDAVREEVDYTIVNPARLPRGLAESV